MLFEPKTYTLNIVEFYCTYRIETQGRIQVLAEGKPLFVEEYVKQIYERQGFAVLTGSDLELFLRFCCAKFDTSKKSSTSAELFSQNRTICSTNSIAQHYATLLKNAGGLWIDYYQLPPRGSIGNLLLAGLNCFSETEVIRLLEAYSVAPVLSPPDLFVYRADTQEKQFIEVKSWGDQLRFDQLQFASMIVRSVGPMFTLAFVLPENRQALENVRAAKALLEHGASHLRKLYGMGLEKVFSNYLAAKDKKAFAFSECGVNPNCLAFYLRKTKNIEQPYNPSDLDFQGRVVSLEQYLERLETEWHKLESDN